jgi:hypothetical protein
MSLLGVLPLLLPEDVISLGCLLYLLLSLGLTMEAGSSPISADSSLGYLLANLKPLHLMPDLKLQRLIFLCNQAWPQYYLDNASKWSLMDLFNPNTIEHLYNFCECTGKWMEIPYIQSFSHLCTKPSLCASSSPAQVLLAIQQIQSHPDSSSDPEAFPAFDPVNEPPPYQSQAIPPLGPFTPPIPEDPVSPPHTHSQGPPPFSLSPFTCCGR